MISIIKIMSNFDFDLVKCENLEQFTYILKWHQKLNHRWNDKTKVQKEDFKEPLCKFPLYLEIDNYFGYFSSVLSDYKAINFCQFKERIEEHLTIFKKC